MILLQSENVRTRMLLHMANIAINLHSQLPRWNFIKHRYALRLDTEATYRFSALEMYLNLHQYGEIYGTAESYGREVIVAIFTPEDAGWAYKVIDMVDILLIAEPSTNSERYYSIWKNKYNRMMEHKLYPREYIDNLINVYQRRPY